METTNITKEEKIQNGFGLIENSFETAASNKVERVKSFSEYAFQKAGLNNGDCLSLKTYLKWISDGHIVDEAFSDYDQHLLKQQVMQKIADKEIEKSTTEGEKRKMVEVDKPALESKVKERIDQIQLTRIDLSENQVQTGYQSEKYIMYMGLTILLSFYLLFFYASAIYASFFRNASSILKLGGDDIVLYLDSIFDVNGIFTPSPSLIIVYLGAFLFFAIGTIPHNIEGKNKKLKIFLAIAVAFVADTLIAYKIDLGIHNLKVMAGIADEDWLFYTSINFYMVLLFGFCAYLVWGYMFEMMLKEKSKKTGDVKAALIIKGLQDEIKLLREELQILDNKIIELESEIKFLIAQCEKLKQELENRLLNPDVLSQNLTSFYMGWRQYLNGIKELKSEKEQCEIIFNEFVQDKFVTPTLLN